MPTHVQRYWAQVQHLQVQLSEDSGSFSQVGRAGGTPSQASGSLRLVHGAPHCDRSTGARRGDSIMDSCSIMMDSERADWIWSRARCRFRVRQLAPHTAPCLKLKRHGA